MKLPRSSTWEFGPPNDYRVFTAWPEGPGPHPVLYVLDANAKFATIVELIRMRTHRPGVLSIVPPVVVGIGYQIDGPYDRTRRSYDLSFGPPSADNPTKAGQSPNPTGGADKFLQFLTENVIPKVNESFNIDQKRTVLLGHSLAGNFVLNLMRRTPDLFSSYIAISPSIWWNPADIFPADSGSATRNLHSDAPDAAENGKNTEVQIPKQTPKVQIAVGEYEQVLAPWEEQLPTAEIIRSRRAARQMVTGSQKLVESLQSETGSTAGAVHHLFQQEDHLSVIHPALNRTLNIAFARREE